MMRAIAALLLAAGSAALSASAPVGAVRSPLEMEIRQARAEAAAATAEEQRLEQAAGQARDEATRMHVRQLAAMQAISAAEAAITASDAEGRLLEGRLALQRRHLAAEQAPVSALLGALVLAARRPPLALLADSESAAELVKLRVLLRSTAPVIRTRTAELKRQLDLQAKLGQLALAARDDLEKRRSELDRRRAQFASLEQQALVLAKQRGSEALGAGDIAIARQEQLADVEANAPSRSQSMKIAQGLAELGPVPFQGPGPGRQPPLTYRLPAEAPVIDGVGAVSENGVRSRGVVMATRRGAALLAPASGTIVFAGPFRDYDGVIIIDHGGGWKSVLVNAGSRVPKGKTVRIGDSLGIALGPIELQLQHKGESVSPALIAGSSAVLSNAPKGG